MILNRLKLALGTMKKLPSGMNRTALNTGKGWNIFRSHTASGGHPTWKGIELDLLDDMTDNPIAQKIVKGSRAGQSYDEIFKGASTTDREAATDIMRSVKGPARSEYIRRAVSGEKWIRTPVSEPRLKQIRQEKMIPVREANKDIYNNIRREVRGPSSGSDDINNVLFKDVINDVRSPNTREVTRRTRESMQRPVFTDEDAYQWKSPMAVHTSRALWGVGAGVVGAGIIAGRAMYEYETENPQEYRPSLAGNTPLAGDGSMGLIIHKNRKPY